MLRLNDYSVGKCDLFECRATIAAESRKYSITLIFWPVETSCVLVLVPITHIGRASAQILACDKSSEWQILELEQVYDWYSRPRSVNSEDYRNSDY